MNACPYDELPDEAFWRRWVGPGEPGPAGAPAQVAPGARIASAGSCFAQHLPRALRSAGGHYLVTEDLPDVFSASVRRSRGYGVFSARYGNVYSARQLLQLFQRAVGHRSSLPDGWPLGDGIADPHRPFVEPGGFSTEAEMHRDRGEHLEFVDEMFRTCDMFVFTVGLTEMWIDRSDGSVVPACPGCGVGSFDPERWIFHNATATEVTADLCAFMSALREVNTSARVVLTVSPIPLVATASGADVVQATTYSKAALRVAAEEACHASDLEYFPSYDYLVGPGMADEVFGPDRRSIRPAAVDRAMAMFSAVYLGSHPEHTASVPDVEARVATNAFGDDACELEVLDDG